MEYFDFEGAAYGSCVVEDDVASGCLELDELDTAATLNDLAFDQSLSFSERVLESGGTDGQQDQMLNLSLEHGVHPMARAKQPCDFCRRMGFDCFVAKRGVMQYGCTCCISLYRECSFTHAQTTGKFLDTLHTVSENIDIPTGGLTGRRTLKSLSGAKMYEEADTRRKSSSRFSRDAVRILKNWLHEHSSHPYPSEEEKDDLKRRTGLKMIQICNWLANARRRGKVRTAPRSSSPPPGAVDIPGKELDMSLMTPLERWKHSPPEHEPASTTDIIRALVNTSIESDPRGSSHPSHVRASSRRTGSSNDSSCANSHAFKAPSVSSFETSRSSISDLSFASAFSHRSSLGSFSSMDKKDRRRRRKAPASVNAFNQQKARSARIFQCTFCTDSFPSKYDWQRHEKSLHLALDKWTCSPEGGVTVVDGTRLCVFCQAPNPDSIHLESHNVGDCQEKEIQERTFYRKDHLNQHLRLMHNVKFHPSMDKWRSTTAEIKSRCGFCGTLFTTWKDRVDHLAAHFKSGADMSQWEGGWGFEPFVQALVENAMPPYLIAQDRKTLDPWKPADRAQHVSGSSGGTTPYLPIPQDANCYHRLERELAAYIREQLAAGLTPTDQMIQNHARTVIYGCDDPWNQTCADNPVWLSIIKRDTGLETVPDSEHIHLDNLGMQPPFALDGGLRLPPIETNPVARTICRRGLGSQSNSNTGSGLPSPGFHSGVGPSMQGSLSGSYVGSIGAVSSSAALGLSNEWNGSYSVGQSSFSTPANDALIQMGFEPEFLQRLSESCADLPPDDMEGLAFESLDLRGDVDVDSHGLEDAPRFSGEVAPFSGATSAPVTIPSPKNTHHVLPGSHQQDIDSWNRPY